MKTYTVKADEKAPKRLVLGRRGEDGATAFLFDLAWFYTVYGPGTVLLKHKRSEDSYPYYPGIMTTETTATWTLDENDTAQEGYGELELDYYTGRGLAKSIIFPTLTLPAISEDISEDDKTALDLLTEAVHKLIDEGVPQEKLAKAIADYFEEHPLPEDTKYTMTIDGAKLTLRGSDGLSYTVTLPDPDLTLYVTKAELEQKGYLTAETDPTVPAWAKAADKPAYTAAEVHALPDNTTIPSKVSELENDEHFVKVDALDAYVLVDTFDEWGQGINRRLTTAEGSITDHGTRLATAEGSIAGNTGRIENLESELAGVDELLAAL